MRRGRYILLSVLALGLMILCSCSSGSVDEESLADYTLQLDVTLEENIILSTYDVEIYLDEEKVGTVKQGETFTETLTLKEGNHDFKVNKSGDTSVSGSTTIKLDGDKAFSCSLKSHSSNIDINNQIEESLGEYTMRKEEERAEKERIEAEKQAAKEKEEQEAKEAQEKAEAEQKEKEAAEAKRNELLSQLGSYEGKLLSDVYDEINGMGLNVTYIATNTGMDMTGAIGEVTDSFYVESIDLSSDNKSIQVNAVPDFIIDQEFAKMELESKLDVYMAWQTAEAYGKELYGDFTLHYFMGKLGETASDDGTSWILKAECTANGTKAICEATVTGTDDNPVVTDFLVY